MTEDRKSYSSSPIQNLRHFFKNMLHDKRVYIFIYLYIFIYITLRNSFRQVYYDFWQIRCSIEYRAKLVKGKAMKSIRQKDYIASVFL